MAEYGQADAVSSVDGKVAVRRVRVKDPRRNGDQAVLTEMWVTEKVSGAARDVLGRAVGHVVLPDERAPIVTDWTGPKDFVNAPPSYDAFYSQYRNYIRHLVSKFGVPPSDLDDVVTDIVMRFIERDSIGVFSGDWATRSQTGKSNFRSYLSRFVVTYARGKNRNVYKHNARNLLIWDAPVDDDGRVSWGDEHAPTTSFEGDLTDRLEFEDLVAGLRARVSPGLVAAVDAVVALAMGSPKIKVSELAQELGVSARVAGAQLEEVRCALGGLVGCAR